MLHSRCEVRCGTHDNRAVKESQEVWPVGTPPVLRHFDGPIATGFCEQCSDCVHQYLILPLESAEVIFAIPLIIYFQFKKYPVCRIVMTVMAPAVFKQTLNPL